MLKDIITKHGLAKTARACDVTTGAVQGWQERGLPNAISKAAQKKRARYERALAKLENISVAELRKQLEGKK